MTVATDAFFVAHCFRKRLTQGDTDVLHRMVSIDMQVAAGFDLEVDQAVARDLVKHVIEKRHTGIQRLLAGAVKVDRDTDLRLVRIARDLCSAWR